MVRKSTALWLRLTMSGLAIGLVGWLLIHNSSTITYSLHEVRQAKLQYFVIAILLSFCTFFIAGAIYCLLALHKLRYLQTVLVELAASFVNRLLPAGLGGLGLHARYLYKRQHSVAEATLVVSINNLLGITAHFCLLFILGAVAPASLPRLHMVYSAHGYVILIPVAGAVAIALILARQRTIWFIRSLAASWRRFSSHPRRMVTAFCLSTCLPLAYSVVLCCCTQSLGLKLGWLNCFFVFSLGIFASTLSPTPGGLVGTEAGLIYGFTRYNCTVPQATAAVILFRLATYWLPLIPGAIAVLRVRQKRAI